MCRRVRGLPTSFYGKPTPAGRSTGPGFSGWGKWYADESSVADYHNSSVVGGGRVHCGIPGNGNCAGVSAAGDRDDFFLWGDLLVFAAGRAKKGFLTGGGCGGGAAEKQRAGRPPQKRFQRKF